MFEKFAEHARRSISLARQEAQRLGSESIATEHLLLGILQHGEGVAVKVLRDCRVDSKRVRLEIEKLLTPSAPPALTLGHMPFSPRARRVMELSGEEAS